MATVASLLNSAEHRRLGSLRLDRERTIDQLSRLASSASQQQPGSDATGSSSAVDAAHAADLCKPRPLTVPVGSYGSVVLQRRSDPPALGATCLRPLTNRPSDHMALAACEVLDRRLCSHCGALEDRATSNLGGGGGAGGGRGFDLRHTVLQHRLRSLMPSAGKEELATAATASAAAADATGRSLTGLEFPNGKLSAED